MLCGLVFVAGCSRASAPPDQTADARATSRPAPVEAVREIASMPSRLMREIDPLTPMNDATVEVRYAARSIGDKVAELDVHTLNQRLAELGDLIFLLQHRLESFPPNLGQQIAQRISDADVSGVVTRAEGALAHAPDTLHEAECLLADARIQLAQFDIARLTTTIDTIELTVRNVGERVAQVDVGAVNAAIGDVHGLRGQLDATLRELAATLADARGKLVDLPLAPFVTELHATAARTGPIATGLLTGVWLLNGLLALLIAGTIRRWTTRGAAAR